MILIIIENSTHSIDSLFFEASEEYTPYFSTSTSLSAHTHTHTAELKCVIVTKGGEKIEAPKVAGPTVVVFLVRHGTHSPLYAT